MFKDTKKKAEEKAGEVKGVTANVGSKITDQARNLGENAAGLATDAVKTAAAVAVSAGKIAKGAVDAAVISIATKIVVRSMKKVGSRGTSYISNDNKYGIFVDRTWEMLPLPVRLVGRESLGYDTAMFTLRNAVFGNDKADLEVNKEDEGIIKKTIRGMF